MSIDARIVAVTVITETECDYCDSTGTDPETNWDTCPRCHGSVKGRPVVRLKLEPRERGCVAGQDVLTLINSDTYEPAVLAGLIGTEIWGNNKNIFVGDTVWAERIGYTVIELLENLDRNSISGPQENQ